MAVQAPEQILAEPHLDGVPRSQWISDRVAEFEADPAIRDRAIATVLFDSLFITNAIAELSGKVRKEGLGGIIKALMSAR